MYKTPPPLKSTRPSEILTHSLRCIHFHNFVLLQMSEKMLCSY